MNSILHIGFGKTATSWFQNNFYPKVTNYKYINRSEIKKLLFSDIENGFKLNKKNFPDNNFIICEEQILSKSLYHINKNATRLKQLFPQSKVIIFIRNQVDLYASKYVQYLKMGGTFCIKEFLLKKRKHYTYAEDFHQAKKYEYIEVIELYIDIFGKDNVNVFVYEDFKSNNSDFLKSFVRILGLNVQLERLKFKNINKIYKRPLLNFMRKLNFFTSKSIKFKKYYFHIPLFYKIIRAGLYFLNKILFFSKTPTPENILGKEMLHKIYSYYKFSNQVLIDKFGLKQLKKYNYPL